MFTTRRLILAALVCGLAILLAGGIQLVLLSQDRAATGQRQLAVGDAVEVGRLTVAVTGAQRADDGFDVVVELSSDGTALADVQAGWALIDDGSELVDRVPTGAGAPPACAGTPLPPGGTVRCRVSFAPPGGTSAVVVFGVDEGRATWSVPV